MSGKKQKLLRKLARKEFEHMQPNQNPQQQLGLQIISLLEDYVKISVALEGEKPTVITLTDIMYNAYIQESQRHAEVLGLKPGFKDEEPVFMGVKLLKKSPIIVPDQAPAQPIN